MSRPGSALAGAAALGAGAALLVPCLLRPPETACEPPVTIALASLALAQVMGLIGMVSWRRSEVGGGVVAAGAIAWAVAATACLLPRTCAGHLDAVGALDVAHAGGAGLALALLLAGLSARLATRGAAGMVVGAIACAGAGWVAGFLAGGRAMDRQMLSWVRVDLAASALAASVAPGDPMPAGIDVPLADVTGGLSPAARAMLELEDAWGHALRYSSDGDGWRVISRGADGAPGPGGRGPVRRYAGDLVMANASPQAWPERPCLDPDERPRDAPVDLRTPAP